MEKLYILWTTSEREVALNMVFMYAINSKANGWWKEIELIIWGPSVMLASGDKEIQEYLKDIKDSGITLKACKACADKYGVSGKLAELGIEVVYMGMPLTEILKGNEKLITF